MPAEDISHLLAHYVGFFEIVQGQDCDCALIEKFQMTVGPKLEPEIPIDFGMSPPITAARHIAT
jgi:hypothetical protein